MGYGFRLGKTFGGSEKLHELGESINLVVCQCSKVDDWLNHFHQYYKYVVLDGRKAKELGAFPGALPVVLIINYDLIFRRPALLKLAIGTLLLDESSLIQNESAKRTKAIMKIQAKNVILLSGTPTGGKYERLWTQAQLLGWRISKDLFYKQYTETRLTDTGGFKHLEILGYKNTERMIRKFKEHGANFLKTDEVFNLPEQTFTPVIVPANKEYRTFRKNRIVIVDKHELIGDTSLTALLYARQLCGQYNKDKLAAFADLIESTNDRIIVFYNFTDELEKMLQFVNDRPVSIINGQKKDLTAYETQDNAIVFVQYQAGAMGLNLQKANKIIYYTPPLSSELFEQSKKRIHRIGQSRPCFYYQLICKNSVEERIYKTLKARKDYTDTLFEMCK